MLRSTQQETRLVTEVWGTVTVVDGQYATIRVDDRGCGRCNEPGGCGGKNIGTLLCGTSRIVQALNSQQHRVGDRVRVSVLDGSLRYSATYAYGFPLLALLAGALLGSALVGEFGAIAGATAGLVVGWLGLRRAQRRSARDPRFQPSIRS